MPLQLHAPFSGYIYQRIIGMSALINLWHSDFGMKNKKAFHNFICHDSLHKIYALNPLKDGFGSRQQHFHDFEPARWVSLSFSSTITIHSLEHSNISDFIKSSFELRNSAKSGKYHLSFTHVDITNSFRHILLLTHSIILLLPSRRN